VIQLVAGDVAHVHPVLRCLLEQFLQPFVGPLRDPDLFHASGLDGFGDGVDAVNDHRPTG
jgi:hypothetical protein